MEGISRATSDTVERHGEVTGSLRHHLREQRIELRSMPMRLRVVTAVAVADLVASVVLLAVRDELRPLVTIGGGAGQLQLALPLVVLLLSTVFFVLGLGYLLAGALHSHPAVAVLGVALVAYVFQPTSLDPFSLATAALLLLLGGVVLASAAFDLRKSRRHQPPRRVAQRIPSTVSIAFVATNCALAEGTFAWYGRPAEIGLGLKAALTLIVTLAIPVFIMAGADLGEWAQLAAAQAAHTASRLRQHVMAVLVGLVLAATIVGAALSGDLNLPRSILPSALFLVLVAAMMTRSPGQRAAHAEVPSRALVIASLVYAAPLVLTALAPVIVGNSLPSSSGVATYRHDAAPPFAVDHPADWAVLSMSRGTMTGVQFQAPRRAAAAQVWVAPYTPAGIASTVLRGICSCTGQMVASNLEGSVRDTVEELSLADGTRVGRVEVWEHNTGVYSIVVLGGASDASFASHLRTFTAIRDNLEVGAVSDPTVTVAQASGRDAQIRAMYRDSVVAIFLLLAGVGAWLLWPRRRRRGYRVTAIVLVIVGAFFLLRYGPPQLATALGKDGGAFPAIDIQGLQIALGVVGLAWLGANYVRRHAPPSRGTRPLLALVVAVQVLGWFDGLYTASAKVGSLRVLQALLVLLAMLWDLAMSGKTVTNGSSQAFPRHARVLIFCGYSMTVAAAVVVLSSLHLASSGQALDPQFESDAWPQFGITFLGIPMVFAAFVLASGGRAWRLARRPAAEPESRVSELASATDG